MYVCHVQMSEKDFWTKYCRAEYLLRTKNTVAATAEAAEDEELAVFLKNDDILAKEAKSKVRAVSVLLNILSFLWCFCTTEHLVSWTLFLLCTDSNLG
jgi:hypothetical protein